jgi:multicomponent Na+:H+ antiporter subunit B
MRNLASLLFAAGLAFFLLAVTSNFDFGQPPMRVGDQILTNAAAETGAANIVTAVVLAYRGIDTLIELAILFTAATAASLVLTSRTQGSSKRPDGGFILLNGADLVFPLLLVVGFYIILHGHLTPGGGFQGGVILAAAFFLPLLARPRDAMNTKTIHLIEGIAGASFILIGLAAMISGNAFLQPMLDHGVMGNLISAGTLPLLYLAVGLKVGSELAGLLAYLSNADMEQS